MRIIHACGMPEAVRDIVFHPDFAAAASQALKAGAPILCDSKMVANGITRARLPANNEIVCTLADPEVPALAAKLGNTRTAAALELWRPRLKGSVVAVGNAPTALFRLLELLDEGADRPAAIIGMPVGFVGAAEVEGSADRGRARALRRGARTQRRQCDGGCGTQRSGERARMSGSVQQRTFSPWGEGQDEGVFLSRRKKAPPHPSPLPEGRGDACSALTGKRQR